jgi:hypothetical protein
MITGKEKSTSPLGEDSKHRDERERSSSMKKEQERDEKNRGENARATKKLGKRH